MNNLTINEFNKILENNNCAFICGNGFSVNFDSCFSDIYDRLYDACKTLFHNGEYCTSSNKKFNSKCKENYNSVKDYLRSIQKNKFYEIFDDGVKFAESIILNRKLVEELENAEDDRGRTILHNLIFNKNELMLIKSIYEVGISKGSKYVNIEYWSILIYIYFAIKQLNSDSYIIPQSNMFIKMVELGDKSTIELFEDEYAMEKTLFNGFSIFYRMLFSIAIFSDGKAIEFEQLNKIDDLNIEKINDFLDRFKVIFTLNYDRLMEYMTSRDVYHLHGSYICDKREYVYYQSLGMKYKDRYISFSDILIGDYFINKGMFLTLRNLSSGKNNNKKTLDEGKILNDKILENKINTIILFGLNVENDEYTMRNLILSLENARNENPNIIYCYFNEEEKMNFEPKYNELNKFSSEVTEYGKSIKINYIQTKDILKKYFNI